MKKEQKSKSRTILGVRVNCFVRFILIAFIFLIFPLTTFPASSVLPDKAILENALFVENVVIGKLSGNPPGFANTEIGAIGSSHRSNTSSILTHRNDSEYSSKRSNGKLNVNTLNFIENVVRLFGFFLAYFFSYLAFSHLCNKSVPMFLFNHIVMYCVLGLSIYEPLIINRDLPILRILGIIVFTVIAIVVYFYSPNAAIRGKCN